MASVMPLIDLANSRGARIQLEPDGRLLVTNAQGLEPEDRVVISNCKHALVAELTAIRDMLNRCLPACVTPDEITSMQDALGLWVLLQAARSKDQAFEEETVAAAFRIYKDKTIGMKNPTPFPLSAGRG